MFRHSVAGPSYEKGMIVFTEKWAVYPIFAPSRPPISRPGHDDLNDDKERARKKGSEAFNHKKLLQFFDQL
jgi:hypothetical protein